MYINELLIKLLPKDASHEELFELYENFLIDITEEKNLEITLRHFELDLLDMLGYGLDFERDIDNNENKIHFNILIFSPKPGQMKLPLLSFLNQFTLNIFGELWVYL